MLTGDETRTCWKGRTSLIYLHPSGLLDAWFPLAPLEEHVQASDDLPISMKEKAQSGQ